MIEKKLVCLLIKVGMKSEFRDGQDGCLAHWVFLCEHNFPPNKRARSIEDALRLVYSEHYYFKPEANNE